MPQLQVFLDLKDLFPHQLNLCNPLETLELQQPHHQLYTLCTIDYRRHALALKSSDKTAQLDLQAHEGYLSELEKTVMPLISTDEV